MFPWDNEGPAMPRGRGRVNRPNTPDQARAAIAPKTIPNVKAQRRIQTEEEKQAELAAWRAAITNAHSEFSAPNAHAESNGVNTAACVNPTVPVPPADRPSITEQHKALLSSASGTAACINPSADAPGPEAVSGGGTGDRPHVTKSHKALLGSEGTGSALRWSEDGSGAQAETAPVAVHPVSKPHKDLLSSRGASSALDWSVPAAPPAAPDTPEPSTQPETVAATATQQPPLRIGYWAIRGLAAPLRMMCTYAGAAFEAVNYEVTGEPGNWDVSSWFAGDKPELVAQNPLMNLPYVSDPSSGAVVAQSNACLRMLGRKFGLDGGDEATRAAVDQVLCQTMDLRNDLVKLCYSSGEAFETGRDAYGATAATHLSKFEKWFTVRGTPFAAGDSPTCADFHLWEQLDQHQSMGLVSLDEYPALQAYYARFAALDGIKAYLQSEHAALPINNKMASLGATA